MIKRAFQDITNLKTKNIKLTIHRSSHRRTLLRWIYEVCADFRYSSYTYATALMIIDAYTQKNGFEVDQYQLIGITALFLAAKIEERQTHKTAEYALVTDGCCESEDILRQERKILESLNYELNVRLPHSYYNAEYFSSNFLGFAAEERREIFHCVLAALMERTTSLKSTSLLYLEAVREMEAVLYGMSIMEDVKFYLAANPVAWQIVKNRIDELNEINY